MRKKKRSSPWGKIALISFIVWVLSVAVFLAASSSLKPEGNYLSWQVFLLVASMGIGSSSFIVFCVSLLIYLWKKSKVVAISLVTLALLIFVGTGAFVAGAVLNKTEVQSPTDFTGQDVFDAVNAYRKEKGVGELTLDKTLCNNLAQRYFDIKAGIEEGVAHKGLDEWFDKFVAPYGNYSVQEDFTSAPTPEEAIKNWEGSPGHRLSILDPKNKVGCSYAAEGYAIIILGYKTASTSQQTTTQNTVPSRTGRIISYHEWCANKDISIYENELITMKSVDGNIYSMTQGDWDCYEDFLKGNK